jgi:WD40 repeat protein
MADAVRDGTVSTSAGQSSTIDPEDTIDGAAPRPASPRVTETPADDYAELLAVERRHYAIVGELAKGGMGRVLEARDLRLGRQVAIKELLPKHRDAARRFEREARITARLQHPAIIHVYEAGVWPGGEPFYAMPKVPGRSLDKVVAEKRTLVERLALVPNVIAVADALAYAHSENVIHRDLKPANVLVGEFGQTVVIDWGVAKDLGEPAPDAKASMALHVRSPSDVTESGGVVGTPAYMPPEQARGEAVDQHADVYAIGALLYKVLSGVAPYIAHSSREVLELVKSEAAVPLDVREPGAPPELVAIVAKAMAREPRDRYATAGELAKDLQRFQTGQLVAAHRYTTRQLVWRFLRRYRLALAVGAIALAALVVGGTLSVRRILAEKSRTEAKRVALLEERGRTELLVDRAGPALRYLVEAAHDRVPDPALSFLLAEAMRPFQAKAIAPLHAGSGAVVLAVSPDGKRVATGTDALETWDLATGAMLRAGTGQGRVRALAFDPSGEVLAAGTSKGIVIVWGPGPAQRQLAGHTGAILDIAFSSDGKRLATASADHTARVWDVATGELVAKSTCHEGPVTSARFSNDGRFLATGGEDDMACVWSVDANTWISFLRGHTGAVRSVRWSRDDLHVVTASDDGAAYVFDAALGKPVAEAKGHTKPLVAAELSPDGTRLLTASADHLAELWELPELVADSLVAARPVAKLDGHTDAIVAATFDADGKRVATAGLDGVARVWDASTGQPTVSFEHAGPVGVVAFAGNRLVTGDRNGYAHVWDVTSSIAGTREDLESTVHALAARDDGTRAAGTQDMTVTLWRDGKLLRLDRHMAPVLAVALDGNTLVSGGAENEHAIVWDVDRAAVRCQLAAHDKETRALASADGVVAIALPEVLEVWSASDCRLLGWRDDAAADLRAVSMHGDLVVAGGKDGIVLRWRPVYGVWLPDAVQAFDARIGAITALALSPDGHALLVGGDGVAKILEVETGRDLWTLDGPFGKVTAVAWLDDARVVTASSEGIAKIWDAHKGKLLGVRGTPDHGASSLAVSGGGSILWIGDDDGGVRAWKVPLADPAVDREQLAAATGWKLGDDDVARRKGEDSDGSTR